ncbi:MAG: hypothetical protein D6748_14430 [Calditrichaeota bacterium]|nr:MAG: hypothetical protein D6748_14430 [Calditrichota bacterium]
MHNIQIHIKTLLCMAIGVIISTQILSAQEQLTVEKATLASGISLQLKGNEIPDDLSTLVLFDSAGAGFALRSVTLDGQKIWLRKSDTPSSVPNTVTWFFDPGSRVLSIDLQGIKSRISQSSVLQVKVNPTLENHQKLKISIDQATQYPVNGNPTGAPIKEIVVELINTKNTD